MEERRPLDDRQLDAILVRLDRIAEELHGINRKLDAADGTLRIAHELKTMNDSLQALAYAALGQSGPKVHRRSA